MFWNYEKNYNHTRQACVLVPNKFKVKMTFQQFDLYFFFFALDTQL